MDSDRTQLFLPCAAGVEALLVGEVTRLLPGASAQTLRGGVALQGGMREAMALNLGSRLAQRVLWRVAEAPYRSEDDLYALAREPRWSAWITPRHTLRVDVTAQRAASAATGRPEPTSPPRGVDAAKRRLGGPLKSLNFAALRIKDAVCDQLRETQGARPDVDLRQPDLPLLLHLSATHATLYVDTSGESLFKRGWRQDQGEAPLKETLAAAMLAAAGWQGREEDGPLLDPVCGSGTIAIEAAQIACGIAPGALRRFAFERQLPFHAPATQQLWRELRAAARAQQHASAVAIFAGDVAFRMTDFAARNAERAGVAQAIDFKTADALQRPAPAERGVMLLNPPYGERIEPKGSRVRRVGSPLPAAREGFEAGESADDFFARLATHWKRHYAGWTAWVLSPDAKLPQAMRLKESRRVPLWNGPIECRLLRFDLVAGSMRERRGEAAPDL